MLLILLSTGIAGLLLMSIGALLCKLTGTTSIRNPFVYFWLGFFITSTLAAFSSFFVPLNTPSLVVFILAGSLGFPVLFNRLKHFAAQNASIVNTVFVFTSVLFFFFIAYRYAYSVWPALSYDTELYHAHKVRWLNEFALVPGLGNLHSRLATNTLWFYFAAIFDNNILDGRSGYLVTVLAWTGCFLYFFYELCATRRNGVRFYALCLLIWSLYMGIKNGAPGLAYDDVIHIINAIVILEAWFLVKDSQTVSTEKLNNTRYIIMLAVSAFMIKPIAAVSLLFTGLIAIFMLLKPPPPTHTRSQFTVWVNMFLIPVIALCIWIVGNIITSGYPLFPVPVLKLPLDWAMTYSDVQSNYDAVLGWARMPGENYLLSLQNGFLFWFKPWLSRSTHSANFLFLCGAPLSLAAFLWFLVIKFNASRNAFLFSIWSCTCILYWFLTAPDLRFSNGFFYVLLGLSFLFLMPEVSSFDISAIFKIKKFRWTLTYLWCVSMVAIIGLTAISSKRSLLTVGTMPSMPIKEYTVTAPIPWKVWIPDSPSGETEDRTGNAPLPATISPPPDTLEMRDPGNLGKGFRMVH
jgi:hypothetical protein